MGYAVFALLRGFNHAEAQPIEAENNNHKLLQLVSHSVYVTLFAMVCQYIC
jgi:hypothetical protein